MKRLLTAIAVLTGLALPAMADWDPGDGHKMHFPQLPDPQGWDIDMHNYRLADDWKCSETGPVTDVHFWVSFQGDLEDASAINSFNLTIYDNVTAGTGGIAYSRPGNVLWPTRTVSSGQFSSRHAGSGNQGWFDPDNPGGATQGDHQQYYQINVENIQNPFTQTKDEIYWLEINIPGTTGSTLPGWKTADLNGYPQPYTGTHYEDDAVWWDTNLGGAGIPGWAELRDPISTESLDLAFVITPEPGVTLLLVAGLFGLGWRRRRAG